MAPLLPFLASGAAVTAVVRQVLAGLGLGVVSFVGLSAILSRIENYVALQLHVPQWARDAVCILQIEGAIAILISAYTVRIAMTVAKRFRVL